MALTHRLHELDLLTDWGYRTACVQLSRLGYRSNEPSGIPRSHHNYSQGIPLVRDDGETPATIAEAIGISVDELQAHVFGLTLTAVHGRGREGPRVQSGLHLISTDQ